MIELPEAITLGRQLKEALAEKTDYRSFSTLTAYISLLFFMVIRWVMEHCLGVRKCYLPQVGASL